MKLQQLMQDLDAAEAVYVSATSCLGPVEITKEQAAKAINDTLQSGSPLRASHHWFGDSLNLFIGTASGEEVTP